MFLARLLLPALVVPAAVGAAVAAGVMDDGPSPLGCEIRISDTAIGREVVPVAWSGIPLAGSYDFTVSKTARSGTAVTSQSGDFETVPGIPTELGTAVFERKGSIAAELTVRWSGGVIACERRFPQS
ncbi:MAG: hypothetical protein KDK07_01300 [Bauldia sp.]|nr:hypothetical protein [Bauldia sp.]